MKASIITLHTVNNYGSVLQTYATQTLFEKLGYEVEFVDYWRRDNTDKYAVIKAMQSPKMQKYKKFWDYPILRNLIKIPLAYLLARKRAPMRKFLKRRIRLTKESYYSLEELRNNVPQADIYVTGSDQVWNSVWNQGIEKPFFLDYAPTGKKRIAFAASIGRTNIDATEEEVIKPMLEKYSSISIREQSGVDILKKMGLEATLVLDPTLMLNKEEWLKIAEYPRIKEPYLLIYQLNENDAMDKYAIALAKQQGWTILRISYGYSGYQKGGKCIVCPDVELLLGLFANAACVLTDSFHATAFSINFSRQFVSVLPQRFFTRITNILKMVGLENRILINYDDVSIVNEFIDYTGVNKILQEKRKESFLFLEKAVDLNE